MMNNTTGQLQISYTLSFPEAQAHYMNVEMNISSIAQSFINLKMPVWTPGSYLVREYAKNLEALTAESDGRPLSAKKTGKNTWHVFTDGAATVKINYRLYAFELTVRTNIVTTAHAFISGAATFLFPAGMLGNPSTVHIKPYGDWDKVSTGLAAAGDAPFSLYAPDYDTLYDSPIEVGTQDIFGFEAAGVKYEVAMCLGGNYDQARLTKDLKLMAEKETAVFGENPNRRYIYIVHNYLKGGGGLEHLNCTVLSATRDGYTDEDTYQKFLSLAAHEHFHLWNVKRLRPVALGPFDYEKENYTTELWIAEGFTSYYDNLIVHRMGLYPVENYLTALCADISATENAPGNYVQPVAEASFDAWIKFYRPNENSANANSSYYSKGSILAMMLDLEIINNSQGRLSLDDVMQYMYTEYYKNKDRGYTAEEFKQGLEKFTGSNLDRFYEQYVYGVARIDYHKYLGYAGFKLIDDLDEKNEPSLGINVINNKISSVIRDGSAWISGLSVNDEIKGIGEMPFTDLATALRHKKVGDEITVYVNREGLPLAIMVKLLKSRQVKYRIVDVESPSHRQLLVRGIWLKQ